MKPADISPSRSPVVPRRRSSSAIDICCSMQHDDPNAALCYIALLSAAQCCTPWRDVMSAKPRISVSLSRQEYQELSALAEKHRISLAWLGRQAVTEFLDRYRDRELQLPLFVPSSISNGE